VSNVTGTTLMTNMQSFLVVCKIQLLFNICSLHLNDLCIYISAFNDRWKITEQLDSCMVHFLLISSEITIWYDINPHETL
jgi:predicted FMN-binding regulatory protein PaiB